MYGLLLRLSALDADAENAVRLISFFDGLLERGATVDELLRSTAMLAECPVGVRTADGSTDQEVDPRGVVVHDAVRRGVRDRSATIRRLTSGDEVWLTRAHPLPLDEILLERFGIAAGVVSGRMTALLPGLGDPALVELVVSEQAGEVERSRALHLLGMTPMTPLRTLAVRGPLPAAGSPDGGPADIVRQLGGRPAGVRSAPLGHSYVVLTAAPMPSGLQAPEGWHVGIGPQRPAIEAPESWVRAEAALRYTRPQNASHESGVGLDDAVRDSATLGGFLGLARHLSGDALTDIPDVLALDALAAGPGGADVLHTLEVLANTVSLRQAATVLHLHHNSVAHRIVKAQETLGFSIMAPGGRVRLALATALRQLRDTLPG